MPASHFAVHQPTSLAEVFDLLAAHKASVRLLAGGTDLLPKAKVGALPVENLVSLLRVPGLDQVSFSPEEGLYIGGTARLSQVARLPEAQNLYPGLAYACSVMATTQIRNMGTVAGNLANAAPSADTATPLLVYDAEVEAQSGQSTRRIPLAEFFTGPGQTVLAQGEVIVAIRAPKPQPPCGSSYQRLSARSKVDIGAAGVSVALRLDDQGRMIDCRLALGAVAPTPRRCRQTEAVLEGQKPTPEVLQQASAQASVTCMPIDDVRSSASYRQVVVRALARRAIEDCLSQAKGGAK